MIPFDPLQFGVVAFAACGLLAVILEKDPRDLWDMIDDVRYFAERPKNAAPAKLPKNAVPHDPRLSA